MKPIHNYSKAFTIFLIIVTILLIIFAAFIAKPCDHDKEAAERIGSYNPEDSIRVKIIKVRKEYTIMKTVARPRMKLKTNCACPYKEKQIVWIKKPQLL